MPDLTMRISTIPIRSNFKAEVTMYEIRIGSKTVGYKIYDYLYDEFMDFGADQREEAIKTFEQMETRKV